MGFRTGYVAAGYVAYGLGFEYPTYFHTFGKKHTGHPPLAWREQGGPPPPASTARGGWPLLGL
ncbi:MAG: hypothetical protein EOO59_00370 [Hymenobacter sp.]|nr:MAG: hypothetical protein EOO59_00370 [Hymenobacter sp.]